jgi:hypothetical protein
MPGLNLPESDWRLLRSIHRAALERYCTRVLEECAVVIGDGQSSAHDRYVRVFRLVRERDDEIAVAFNDLRRSTAIRRLASMIILGVVTDAELGRFTAATRESATALVEISGPRRKRPKPV